MSKDSVYLFVDGRYHVQADLEVNHDDVTVVKLQMGDKILEEFANRMTENSTLGICSRKNSQFRYENLVKTLSQKNISVKLFDEDPIEKNKKQIKKQRKVIDSSEILFFDLEYQSKKIQLLPLKIHLRYEE